MLVQVRVWWMGMLAPSGTVPAASSGPALAASWLGSVRAKSGLCGGGAGCARVLLLRPSPALRCGVPLLRPYWRCDGEGACSAARFCGLCAFCGNRPCFSSLCCGHGFSERTQGWRTQRNLDFRTLSSRCDKYHDKNQPCQISRHFLWSHFLPWRLCLGCTWTFESVSQMVREK